jgi:hypothetical protein
MLALWLSAALAQSSPTLVQGTPEFQSCLTNPGCADRFYRFLGLSMAEQGFTFQNDPQLLSPTLSRREGFTAGALLTTFPFAKPRENLSGKEENTSYSPVLPRIFGGYKGEGPGNTRVGAGAFFLPPIPVGGASALIAGIETGAALPVGEVARVGLELDFTYTRARAPIVASEEQYEARGDFDNPNNLDPEVYEEVCLPDGCVDTFTVANGGVRVAASVDAGPLAPYVKVGLNTVSERLQVQYDDTTWGLSGIQPVAHLGSLLFIGDHVDLGLGAAFGVRPAALNLEPGGGAGLYAKVQGSAGWTF